MPAAVKFALMMVLGALCAVPALRADVIVTQLANEGVILSDGGSARVMIDGMVVEPYALYGGLPPEAAAQFFEASGPFEGIGLALASHQHHDHNQPSPACRWACTGCRSPTCRRDPSDGAC